MVQMMVTLGIYVRRWQRILRRWVSNPRIHELLQGVGYFLAGFCGSAASLGHRLQPIAIALLCAQTGWPAVLLAIGSSLGYLLFWGSAGAVGLAWTALAFGATLLLQGKQIRKETPLLMPAVAAFIVAATGLLFQYYQLDGPPVPMYLLQITVAAGTTGVFCRAMERRDPIVEWLICGLAVLCLAQVAPTPYLSVGYFAAGFLAMRGAFPAAAMAGLALDLAQVTPTPMTAVLCLAYLVRMIPKLPNLIRHLGTGTVYLLVMGLCGVWDLTPLPGLLVGGLIAMLLPGRTGIFHRRGETGSAQVHLELAASVFRQMEGAVLDTEEAPIDEQALIVRGAERACGSCPYRKNCREEPAQLSPAILHKPLGNGADLPAGCRKTGRLLAEMRRSQEQLRTIRADRDRQAEYRAAVGQQYGFLSAYLQDLSDGLARRSETPRVWFKPEISACSAGKKKHSGDCCVWFAGISCRYYVLLCDGMGTGAEAERDAKQVSNMLKRLLSAGYPASYALRSINSLCALQGRAGAVTVDLAELRLDTGKATLYKWGAAPSYLISGGEPIKIGTATPPPGLSVADGRETVERLSLRRGETLVLLSDGAGGEESLRRVWVDAFSTAEELAAEILRNTQAESTDDATVAVVRLHNSAMTP